MKLFIGLDGGGTGCRAQAQWETGRRTDVFQGGPANMHTDPDGALRVISGLLGRCLAAAQTLESESPMPAPHVVLGLAGASETNAAAGLRAALAYRNLTVLGDIEIALSGAFREQDGIVMAVGTGSVLARQTHGMMQRLGGYGFLLGDEGSGAWIGRAALAKCLLARDGLAPDGTLPRALWGQFGSVGAVLAFSGQARPADFATLAPQVLDHDAEHCPVAAAILDEACQYFRRAIATLQRGQVDIPIAPSGGLGAALLARLFAQGGATLRTVAPLGTALDGAIWQATRRAQA